jgi:glycosyltransferase involved in cell wall biosynthesis
MMPSATHLVLIPSYNPGRLLAPTITAASAAWSPVWVIDDASTDHSPAEAAAADRLIRRPVNGGKGAALLDGLAAAGAAGFTHALTMDADGQHPAAEIPRFMATSEANPAAMILGTPIFGPEAPALRLHGRKLSNWWTRLETAGAIHDSLFGFRVYPIAPLLAALTRSRHMRRYDLDVEAAVRLAWAGVPAINLPAPVTYPSKEAGGVSHFHYLRDNALLTRMHARLLLAMLTGRR